MNTQGSFTVTASGFPTPNLSEDATDTLPAGVTFNPVTGVLGGTPATGTAGTYTLHFHAANGIGANASQTFTLTVNAITTTLTSPSGPIATDIPTFVWSTITGAARYDLWISDLTTGQNPVLLLSNLSGTTVSLSRRSGPGTPGTVSAGGVEGTIGQQA